MTGKKYILVSGGSGDIGRHICMQLATKGYSPLVGYARNKKNAEETAEKSGGHAIALNLENTDSIQNALDRILSDYSPLHGAVLAASPPPAFHFQAATLKLSRSKPPLG